MPKKYVDQQQILTNDQGHISVVIETDNAGIGGGTQYSDADVNADPTGTVAMGTDGTNVYAVHTDTAGDLQVDVLTLPAVTGTVDLGATDNAVLDAIEADTTTIAGAVAGTEMQVDVVAALPAGTNAIGKLLQ